MMRPPDRLVARLLDSPDIERLLVVNPPRWAPTALARRALGLNAKFPASAGRRLVSPLRWRRDDPTDVSAITSEYARYGEAVHRAAERDGLRAPFLVTTNPLTAAFGGFEWCSSVVYYGRDDWLSSPARRQYWPAYQEAYRRIAASGAAVAGVSAEIIERIAPTGPHRVVPNGVEPAEWVGPRPPPPDWLAMLPGPRAVYMGMLDSRLDVEGLLHLARTRPDLRIVLVGPALEPGYLAPLRAALNIHIHDRKVDRREVVAVLRNAELSLVAHRRTPLTEAMSPLKAYEYLAAGTPVLSIDLPPMRGLDDRVLLVPSVADFAEVVDTALRLGPANEPDRLAFIAENSWEARHRMILALTES